MKLFAAVLSLTVMLLEYRVWMSERGIREVTRLGSAVELQAAANLEQRERNRRLLAEVNDLKGGGLSALEERARSELGMVGNSETFYQVVTAATPPPAAPARGVTARSQ